MKIKQRIYSQASDGEHVAVVADVIDLPGQVTRYGVRDQVRVSFLLDEKADGEPVRTSILCSASLHQDAKLRQLLNACGIKVTGTLDTDTLLNKGCRIQTERRTVGERAFANVVGMSPLRKGDKLPAIPLGFKRQEARPQRTNGKPPAMPEEEGESLFS